jgi:flagellar hook protein FlgE
MLRSMYSGISGLKNFQTKLDVIGNNIANVNTYGFKKGRVTFKDTMNQTIAGASAATANRGGKNPTQVGLGATLASIDTIHTQSSLQTTGRSLDLAIDGDGYFIVRQGNANYYTRAGNFYLDNFGTLVNSDGLKVQAYDQNGVLGDVVVNVNAVLPAIATTNIDISENLSSQATVGTIYDQQIEVIDENGNAHRVDVTFTKTSATMWELTMSGDPEVVIELEFDANGQLIDPAGTQNITLTPQVGTAMNITLNFNGLTHNPGSSSAILVPDGNVEGMLESFNIGAQGEINGIYSNGLVRQIGTLAIAKFSNPSGLSKAGNNLFQESINSGTANIGMPGEGRGVIASGALEMSNVDLSEEFTEMIVAQRGFQANTRIITTSDEILQELVNLKR